MSGDVAIDHPDKVCGHVVSVEPTCGHAVLLTCVEGCASHAEDLKAAVSVICCTSEKHGSVAIYAASAEEVSDSTCVVCVEG